MLVEVCDRRDECLHAPTENPCRFPVHEANPGRHGCSCFKLSRGNHEQREEAAQLPNRYTTQPTDTGPPSRPTSVVLRTTFRAFPTRYRPSPHPRKSEEPVM